MGQARIQTRHNLAKSFYPLLTLTLHVEPIFSVNSKWVSHMKKHLFLISFALSAMLPVASALAADFELPPPPPPVEELRPATYDWSGFYFGAWGGMACINGTLTDNTASAGPGTFTNAGCGGKGGATVGYNQQIENIVYGIEGDWGTSGNIVTNDDAYADYTFKLKSIATLRGRVGYAMDDTMFFLTGGGAWATGELNGIISAYPDHLSSSHYGWTVGGGVEHAFTDHLSVKLDYLFSQMNDANYYSTSCSSTCDVDVHWGGEHEIRFGVNFKL
jgi:outer membrane immunogenic protein